MAIIVCLSAITSANVVDYNHDYLIIDTCGNMIVQLAFCNVINCIPTTSITGMNKQFAGCFVCN